MRPRCGAWSRARRARAPMTASVPTTTSGCCVTSPNTPIEPALTHGICAGRRDAGPGPDRRHRALAARLLRRTTRADPEGRAFRAGARSARGTPALRAPSRAATGRTGAATGCAPASLSVTFVSAAALEARHRRGGSAAAAGSRRSRAPGWSGGPTWSPAGPARRSPSIPATARSAWAAGCSRRPRWPRSRCPAATCSPDLPPR